MPEVAGRCSLWKRKFLGKMEYSEKDREIRRADKLWRGDAADVSHLEGRIIRSSRCHLFHSYSVTNVWPSGYRGLYFLTNKNTIIINFSSIMSYLNRAKYLLAIFCAESITGVCHLLQSTPDNSGSRNSETPGNIKLGKIFGVLPITREHLI